MIHMLKDTAIRSTSLDNMAAKVVQKIVPLLIRSSVIIFRLEF